MGERLCFGAGKDRIKRIESPARTWGVLSDMVTMGQQKGKAGRDRPVFSTPS